MGWVVVSVAIGADVAVSAGSSTGSGVGACIVGAGSVVGDGGAGVSTRATTGAVVAVDVGAVVATGAVGAGCSAGASPPHAKMTMAIEASAAPMSAFLKFRCIAVRVPPYVASLIGPMS